MRETILLVREVGEHHQVWISKKIKKNTNSDTNDHGCQANLLKNIILGVLSYPSLQNPWFHKQLVTGKTSKRPTWFSTPVRVCFILRRLLHTLLEAEINYNRPIGTGHANAITNEIRTVRLLQSRKSQPAAAAQHRKI
jgi:hypothetical protein